jgi:predicted MPP superfamily phosphohydrolase
MIALTTSPHPNDGALARRAAWRTLRDAMELEDIPTGPDGPRARWRAHMYLWGARMIGPPISLIGLYGRGMRNALDIGLTRFDLSWPQLPPSFDGYRILHVSDTHFGVLPALAQAVSKVLDGLTVDLGVLTGDYSGSPHDPFADAAVAPLVHVLSVATILDGSIAVLGDHDRARTAESLEAHGIRVLINESVLLERSNERIIITGLDDVHRFYTDAAAQALNARRQQFGIALVHSPELADVAANAGYALYLCGHTHGGQVCLPGGKPLTTQLTRCRFASAGLWRCGQMTGYTSRGIGVVGAPLRFNCRGEVALITLRTSPPKYRH